MAKIPKNILSKIQKDPKACTASWLWVCPLTRKQYFKFISFFLFWKVADKILEKKREKIESFKLCILKNYLLIFITTHIKHNLFIFELKLGANSLNKIEEWNLYLTKRIKTTQKKNKFYVRRMKKKKKIWWYPTNCFH